MTTARRLEIVDRSRKISFQRIISKPMGENYFSDALNTILCSSLFEIIVFSFEIVLAFRFLKSSLLISLHFNIADSMSSSRQSFDDLWKTNAHCIDTFSM